MEQPTGPQEIPPIRESGVFRRMVNVFFSPNETFFSVTRRVRHKDWIVPLVISAIVGLISLQMMMPVIEAQTRARLEQMADEKEMTEEQRERVFGMTQKMSGISATVGAVVMVFVMAFVLALILMAMTNFLMGGEATFKQALAVTSYTSLIGIPAAIVMVPLALAKGTIEVQFGPGLFLPDEMSGSFVYALLANINLFNIWQLAVVCIGMGIVAIVPTRKVGYGVAVLYIIYLAAAAAAKTAFGG